MLLTRTGVATPQMSQRAATREHFEDSQAPFGDDSQETQPVDEGASHPSLSPSPHFAWFGPEGSESPERTQLKRSLRFDAASLEQVDLDLLNKSKRGKLCEPGPTVEPEEVEVEPKEVATTPAEPVVPPVVAPVVASDPPADVSAAELKRMVHRQNSAAWHQRWVKKGVPRPQAQDGVAPVASTESTAAASSEMPSEMPHVSETAERPDAVPSFSSLSKARDYFITKWIAESGLPKSNDRRNAATRAWMESSLRANFVAGRDGIQR